VIFHYFGDPSPEFVLVSIVAVVVIVVRTSAAAAVRSIIHWTERSGIMASLLFTADEISE